MFEQPLTHSLSAGIRVQLSGGMMVIVQFIHSECEVRSHCTSLAHESTPEAPNRIRHSDMYVIYCYYVLRRSATSDSPKWSAS
ncbi:hypothetical protein AFLA_002017 [Aspergillus flavus NRRL3357]|nr:hypothetical protein AFLA_002017 [Aspergillus flavus NRRL3357]